MYLSLVPDSNYIFLIIYWIPFLIIYWIYISAVIPPSTFLYFRTQPGNNNSILSPFSCHKLLNSLFISIALCSWHLLCCIQFSCSVVSDSLWPHEPQHARPPCPLPTPGVHPDPCPLSWWCHLTISSSVIPFSSCPQTLPASGSFQMNQLFA